MQYRSCYGNYRGSAKFKSKKQKAKWLKAGLLRLMKWLLKMVVIHLILIMIYFSEFYYNVMYL